VEAGGKKGEEGIESFAWSGSQGGNRVDFIRDELSRKEKGIDAVPDTIKKNNLGKREGRRLTLTGKEEVLGKRIEPLTAV